MLSETQTMCGSKPSLRQFATKRLCQRSGMMIGVSRSYSMRTSLSDAPMIWSLFMTTTSGSFGKTIDS